MIAARCSGVCWLVAPGVGPVQLCVQVNGGHLRWGHRAPLDRLPRVGQVRLDLCVARVGVRLRGGLAWDGGVDLTGRRVEGREGVVVVGELVRDGGGEVAADPPPQGCGSVIVGEQSFAGGGAEEPAGVQSDAGDLGEPVGQDGQVGVAVGGGRQLVEQGCPFGDGGGEVVGDALVEACLPAGFDGRVLPFAGGSGVGGRRGVRGPPRFSMMINTDKEYMAGLRYIATKYISVSTHYDSDMGLGAGITFTY